MDMEKSPPKSASVEVDVVRKEPIVLRSDSKNVTESFYRPMCLLSGKSVVLLSSGGAYSQIDEVIESYVFDSSTSKNETSSSLESPLPITRFSPPNKCMQYKREKLTEEFVVSEQEFSTYLRLLSVYYLEPMVNSTQPLTQIIIMYGIVESLRYFHDSFLLDLNCLGKEKDHSFPEKATSFFKQIYNRKSLYVDYISLYKSIMERQTDIDMKESHIILGAKLILECTQPYASKLDLSFYSLLLKPVSRITKYKIMFESFVKTTTDTQTEYSAALGQILNTLDTINTDLRLKQECIKETLSKKIEALIENNQLMLGPLQYCGSLYCVWVEGQELATSKCCAIFVYKTYFAIASSSLKRSKDCLFLIPFESCKISDGAISEGGLYTNYQFKIKILFENNYQKFEVMLISSKEEEFGPWNECFKSYLFLNRKNRQGFQYLAHCEQFPISTKYPSHLRPYEVDVSKVPVSVIKNCYFSQLTSIYVTSVEQEIRNKREIYVYIKDSEKKAVDRQLSPLWPKGLPTSWNKFTSSRTKSWLQSFH